MRTQEPQKFLVTGGSGFIGTNLVERLAARGDSVLNIDIKPPQNARHASCFVAVDILNKEALVAAFRDFRPEVVVHLAARTDLNENRDLRAYSANIEGVANVLQCVSACSSARACVFASTKLVCATDYVPKSDDEYHPTTLYGKSKALGEQLVRDSHLDCPWCIVRPTSIWGPWSIAPHIPYGRFFRLIAKGCFAYPGRQNPPKSFGYVGNTVYQILRLVEAPPESVQRKVFYLTDYENTTVREWADLISVKLRGRRVRTIPEPLVQGFAKLGDLMKWIGVREPPFSSFRLQNMRANTAGVPIESIRGLTGPLPYTLEQGVDETIAWLVEHAYIDSRRLKGRQSTAMGRPTAGRPGPEGGEPEDDARTR